MGDWEPFDLDGDSGYTQQLASRCGAELLSEPPGGFGDVPPGGPDRPRWCPARREVLLCLT
jgi:hypothetical protein